MRTLTLGVVLLVAACGGTSGSTMTVKTTGAEISSVANHRTYMHTTADNAPEGYARGSLRPVVLEKARQVIDTELQAKGYRLVDNGELVVRISTGTRTVEEEPSGRTSIAGAPERQEIEGALVIDILERGSEKPLFHGFAHDVMRGGELKDEQVTQAVTKMLAPVPASSPR